MPRAEWCRPEIYEFFDDWRRRCLIRDGALMGDARIWTDSALAELQTTMGTLTNVTGTFFEKLETQLVPHRPEVRQLGVEIVFVEYLGERDTGAPTKREKLGSLMSAVAPGLELPPVLSEILDGGIASFGPGKGYRHAYVQFLLRLARRAKQVVAETGVEAVDDPWAFRDLVAEVRTSTDAMQANAVLHACFPEHFDVMISEAHRSRLLTRFSGAEAVSAAADRERAMLAAREVLRTNVPVPFREFYDDPVRNVWDGAPNPGWSSLLEQLVVPAGADQPTHGSETLPAEDADLLEGLRQLIETSADWDSLLLELSVRLAARGDVVRQWDPLLEALRSGVGSLLEQSAAPVGDTASPVPAQLAPITTRFATELLLSQQWLQELVNVLAERRQVVLYGPPGTGKTWLARAIGRHLAPSDRVRLVQFHPSYTYEDFVEGFRPRTVDGNLTYELVPGPLRTLVELAEADPEAPVVLVVDEINRGNLAKIFGELYFLLEYRDEPLRLQYSPDTDFALPRNLYVIGTMNTADRSIALLDAALRRRFAFFELSPHQPPVEGLLMRWLEREGLDPEPAVLLDALNDMLLSEDGEAGLAVGPSYFMRPSEDLGRVWAHDILPLLAERFHGAEFDVGERFGLAAVEAEAARRADDGGTSSS